jgi:hypothetical protein
MGTLLNTPVNTPASGTSFLDETKFLQEHLKIVLGLATGSLLLSVTFLHDLGTSIQGKYFLQRSWCWFVASILAGVACNYFLTLHLHSPKRYQRPLNLASVLLHLCFIVAIVYFFRFALANLAY